MLGDDGGSNQVPYARLTDRYGIGTLLPPALSLSFTSKVGALYF